MGHIRARSEQPGQQRNAVVGTIFRQRNARNGGQRGKDIALIDGMLHYGPGRNSTFLVHHERDVDAALGRLDVDEDQRDHDHHREAGAVERAGAAHGGGLIHARPPGLTIAA